MKPRTIYRLLASYNDYNAVKKGRVGRRVGRRIYGKLTGGFARRLFS